MIAGYFELKISKNQQACNTKDVISMLSTLAGYYVLLSLSFLYAYCEFYQLWLRSTRYDILLSLSVFDDDFEFRIL